jgi:hypothetical protein
MGIRMLTVNLVCVSKKRISAVVVTICMLLHQYVIPTITCRSRVRLPFTNQRDSSMGRATDNHVGSSPTSRISGIGGTGRRKALRMLVLKEVHRFSKNGGKHKVGVACWRPPLNPLRRRGLAKTPIVESIFGYRSVVALSFGEGWVRWQFSKHLQAGRR